MAESSRLERTLDGLLVAIVGGATAGLIAARLLAPPTITIVHMEPYGGLDNLKGRVADLCDGRRRCYANVNIGTQMGKWAEVQYKCGADPMPPQSLRVTEGSMRVEISCD